MSTIETDTIVAVASGALPSGIAVVRVSGPDCQEVAGKVFEGSIPPRRAVLRKFINPADKSVVDVGLVLSFRSPSSYTGEDVLEFHAHGGRAVVSAILDVLCDFDGVRLAVAGEFSRRAFENGRIDLTEVDGIADLLASETEAQRRLALAQSQGKLRELYDAWRKKLIHIRAMIEAEFDFSDEEDVPAEISEEGFAALAEVVSHIEKHLDDGRAGEIVRDGFHVALLGPPNIGKSSLLNAIADRDVAIVTDEAGTTRDVLDVRLDINGYEVVMSDTAGIRDAESLAEREGIKRARLRADDSDLVIVLVDKPGRAGEFYLGTRPVLEVVSKDDSGLLDRGSISSQTGHGLDWLTDEIGKQVAKATNNASEEIITRKRYRDNLGQALVHLKNARDGSSLAMELRAEELRMAGDCIGRITGKIDVEDLLDVIFSEFCVGK